MFGLILFFTFNIYLSLSFLGPLYLPLRNFFWLGFGALNIMLFAQLWLYFIFFQSSAETKLLFEKPIQRFAFLSMGFISFLFTFTLMRDVIGLIPFLVFKPVYLYSPEATVLILIASMICFVIGAIRARFHVSSPHVEIPILQLSPSLEGLKVVQLSDVHVGTGPNLAQVKVLVDRALSLSPDIIVLTGDIIDAMVNDVIPELKELARLKAPQGVYFVLGNHECYWKHEDAIRVMREMGVVVLLNEGVEKSIRGEKVFIAGINDPAGAHFGAEAPKILTPPQDAALKMVLVHQPQIAPKVAEFGYDLQLSGHTHGGQFFPWNLITRKIYAIHGGLGKVKNMWVYVSVGSGYWGPPVRLGTDGEVTELVFKAKTI